MILNQQRSFRRLRCTCLEGTLGRKDQKRGLQPETGGEREVSWQSQKNKWVDTNYIESQKKRNLIGSEHIVGPRNAPFSPELCIICIDHLSWQLYHCILNWILLYMRDIISRNTLIWLCNLFHVISLSQDHIFSKLNWEFVSVIIIWILRLKMEDPFVINV